MTTPKISGWTLECRTCGTVVAQGDGRPPVSWPSGPETRSFNATDQAVLNHLREDHGFPAVTHELVMKQRITEA